MTTGPGTSHTDDGTHSGEDQPTTVPPSRFSPHGPHATSPPVDPVLVAYLFAPTGGPVAARGFEGLRAIWDACGDRLGMDQEIAATGAPSAFPASVDGLATQTGLPPTGRVLSARAGLDPEVGRGEALLRLHHDVLSLAVRLGPPNGPRGWRDLDARWSEVWASAAVAVAGVPLAATLLGSVRLYLGLLGEKQPDLPAAAPVARRLLPALPAPTDDGWVDRGAATRSGYAVWEVADQPEGRVDRRIVAVAARSGEHGLSAWAWSRGTAEMTPFGYYLLQAAKIRYLVRLWDDGRRVRKTLAGLDGMVAALARLLAEIPDAGAAGGGAAGMDSVTAEMTELAARGTDLRRRALAAAATAANQAAEIGGLAQAVDIARSNLAEALRAEAPAAASAGLFGDDAELAELFGRRLADEQDYAQRALGRARTTEEHAAGMLGPVPQVRPERPERLDGPERPEGSPAPAPGRVPAVPAVSAGPAPPEGPAGSAPPEGPAGPAPRAVPQLLEGAEREGLLRELARVAYLPELAAQVLADAGLERDLQTPITGSGARSAWTANLQQMEHGRVRDPHHRLVRAALAAYPYNDTFRAAARRLGLDLPD